MNTMQSNQQRGALRVSKLHSAHMPSWCVCGVCAVMVLCIVGMIACRKEQAIPQSEVEIVEGVDDSKAEGILILNSGGAGNNQTTLDYFDLQKGEYHRNVYAESNPTRIPTLGDNGLDMAVHEEHLYISVNRSHRVEILNRYTFEHVASIEGINDCRYLAFDTLQHGYVTSYLAPGRNTATNPVGEVVRFSTDINTLGQITGRIPVGYQPEQMLVMEQSKMYVVNSGMYNPPKFDNRLTEIDLKSFRAVSSLSIAPNIHRIGYPTDGLVWVGARGNLAGDSLGIYPLTKHKEDEDVFYLVPMKDVSGKDKQKSVRLDFKVLEMAEANPPYMYILEGDIDLQTGRYADVKVKKIHALSKKVEKFQLDATSEELKSPISIAVDPTNGDVLIGDATNYNSSGMLYCFNRQGKFKWKVRTGIIPIRIIVVES